MQRIKLLLFALLATVSVKGQVDQYSAHPLYNCQFSEIYQPDRSSSRSSSYKGSLWQAGQTIRVKFLNGSTTQKNKIKRYAVIWESYANIKFNFVTSGQSDIRVKFDLENGNWSAVGTSVQYYDQNQPTMNYALAELKLIM